MCDNCNHEAALRLSDATLAALEPYETRNRDFVEDTRQWIANARHVTEKQLAALEKVAERHHVDVTRPSSPSPSPAASTSAPTLSLVPRQKQVLVLGTKAAFDDGRQDEATAAVRELIAGAAEVHGANEYDWPALSKKHGGWKNVYKWAATAFDVLVLLETSVEGLGRGQYDTALLFRMEGKRVVVFRDGQIRPCRVEKWTAGTENEAWRDTYGRVVYEV